MIESSPTGEPFNIGAVVATEIDLSGLEPPRDIDFELTTGRWGIENCDAIDESVINTYYDGDECTESDLEEPVVSSLVNDLSQRVVTFGEVDLD